MTTRLTKPARRIVYGGNTLGELTATLRYGGVLLKPKGLRSKTQVYVSWNTIYRLGRDQKESAPAVDIPAEGGT